MRKMLVMVLPLIFMTTITSIFVQPALAKTEKVVPAVNKQMPKVTPTPTPIPKVEYILPYPGLLPDSPLYIVKRLRDFILERLIVDPLRKSEFYLLQADKHLQMSVFLVQKNKVPLALETLTKGEGYMQKSLSLLEAIRQGGTVIPEAVIDRLERALAKHREVLLELQVQISDGQKETITQLLTQISAMQSAVIKLR